MIKYFKWGIFLAFLLVSVMWNTGNIREWISDKTMPWRHGIDRQRNIMIPMRDGIHLSTQIFKPANIDFPLPTILMRTTYGGVTFHRIKLFTENGFAVIVQNVRGRYGSEGIYSTHRYSRHDGHDTISWIVKQEWSNGKVGTFGCSYLGETQSILAASKHPNHIAMITDGGGGAIGNAMDSYGYFGVYENGVLNLASALGWYTKHGAVDHNDGVLPKDYETRLEQSINELPISSLARKVVPYETGFDDLVTHTLTDSWWNAEGYIKNTDTFATAGLHINNWFDQTVQDTFKLAQLMEKKAVHPRAKHQYVLIGPGEHCTSEDFETGKIKIGDLEFDYNDIDYEAIYIDWFSYWLKEEQTDLPSKFQYYKLRNSKWATSEKWPPETTKPMRLFLASSQQSDKKNGLLQREVPPKQVADKYRYNPANPVPTLGGPICCTGREEDIPGPLDQRSIEDRSDILIYKSRALTEPLEMVGSARIVLNVSTNAPDTDFTAKLIDKFPDGKSLSLQDGVVRLRYRDGIENPKLAEPHKIYEVQIILRPIAYLFEEGHQIVIHISSSNFPRLARNLNTGEHEYQGKRMQEAINQVYHDTLHPSFIELPVIQ
ncbi:MAG: CocE/NonD family hydrolase [Deltaproteobacteria bacterium]|uniref:CocE/NonD family hydrolase n=1 Tax=Desulfobacula sp. TaxID=2593537 RepID=UPI0019B7DA8C|nr:CocE/NonD family hydrolase [Candidatus Desulfobacula maris]MBL6992780.1 CocE/NonD family hydrolase [Desulfobacula sp.]